MRARVTSVAVALGLSLLFSAAIVAAAQLQNSNASADALAGSFGEMVLSVVGFAILPALAAIALAEVWRVQGLAYWLAAGLLIAIAGSPCVYLRSIAASADHAGGMIYLALPVAGLVGGWIYWRRAGYRSGGIAAALKQAGEIPLGPALSAHRCKVCTSVTLLIGLVPLALAAAALIYGSSNAFPGRLLSGAEAEARGRLDRAKLTYLSVVFDDKTGRVIGTAPEGTSPDQAFKEAETALAPLVGFPGVVARLDNGVAEFRRDDDGTKF